MKPLNVKVRTQVKHFPAFIAAVAGCAAEFVDLRDNGLVHGVLRQLLRQLLYVCRAAGRITDSHGSALSAALFPLETPLLVAAHRY